MRTSKRISTALLNVDVDCRIAKDQYACSEQQLHQFGRTSKQGALHFVHAWLRVSELICLMHDEAKLTVFSFQRNQSLSCRWAYDLQSERAGTLHVVTTTSLIGLDFILDFSCLGLVQARNFAHGEQNLYWTIFHVLLTNFQAQKMRYQVWQTDSGCTIEINCTVDSAVRRQWYSWTSIAAFEWVVWVNTTLKTSAQVWFVLYETCMPLLLYCCSPQGNKINVDTYRHVAPYTKKPLFRRTIPVCWCFWMPPPS